ncbi:alpha/beta hydrolase [Actinophytocola sp.]|uniref:alpha/beta hydrolase n=1 Tax=Actinophytocola sp. TaxID=1872138 RepID=UPI0039C85C1C
MPVFDFGRMIQGLRGAAREQMLVAMLATIPRLLRHDVWRTAKKEQGRGLGVLLVPGFGCGDRTLTLTRQWLRTRGYRPAGARIGLNIGCTTELVHRIEKRLEGHAEHTGGPVVMLGQSRGGWLARIVAVRRPELVRGLVLLGSPVLDPLGVRASVVRTARMLTRLSSFGLRGFLNDDCFDGDCYQDSTAALNAPLPAGIPAVAVYSRVDGVVPWRLCQDPCAECVEIHSSHTAMALHPDFYRILEPRLASWAADRGATARLSRRSA